MIFKRERKGTAIKFCGITDAREAALSFEAGADACGVILAPSPRQVTLRTAAVIAKSQERPSSLIAVVGNDLSIVPDLLGLGFTIQFSAPIDSPRALYLTAGAPYLRVIHVALESRARIELSCSLEEIPLFDTAFPGRFGGTGCAFEWSRIADIAGHRSVIIAGGLHPGNVAACISSARPFAVDVRSGIETGQRKSISKMRSFVQAVRKADAANYAS